MHLNMLFFVAFFPFFVVSVAEEEATHGQGAHTATEEHRRHAE